jgi:hypothetical protein
MKKTWSLFLPIAVLLASCGGSTSLVDTKVYFSTVFQAIESTYQINKTAQNQFVGNFALEVNVTRNTATVNQQIFLYETGLTTIRTGSQTIDGQLVNSVITTTYDYGSTNGGVFTQTFVSSNPALNTKVYAPFTNTSLQRITSLYDSVNNNLDTDIRAKINAQVTDLVIGGQEATTDLKTYTIPVNEITTNYAKFSGVTSFTPSAVTLLIKYRSSNQHVEVAFNATATNQTYAATYLLSQSGTVSSSAYTLSLQDKLTFTGFTN